MQTIQMKKKKKAKIVWNHFDKTRDIKKLL